MSEAVCGPSNPLQQFKQQTQVDRTLQRDRLTSRHAPAQSFRSADPSAHFIDAEFEAFQAGAPLHDFQPFHQLPLASPAPFAAQQLPSWASDFQRLQITSPASSNQLNSQFVSQDSAPSWAADFRQHVSQPGPRAQSSSPSPWAFQQRARYGMSGSAFGEQGIVGRPMSKGKAAVRQDFDEAAFARAFDMVAQESEPFVDESMGETTQHADIFENPEAMEDVIERAMKESIFDPETVLGNVVFDEPDSWPVSDVDYNGAGLAENLHQALQEEPKQETQQDGRADDDALAFTAGELLDRVKDNQSDKFQNSTFLDLMRKLKDREVRVEGDKMVETVGATSIPYVPKRHLSPDSGYGSVPSTPPPMMEEPFVPACDVLDEHRWDHWESPYT